MKNIYLIILLFASMQMQGRNIPSVAAVKEANTFKTLKAAFVQTRHSALVEGDLVSKGVLYMVAPDKLRWELVSPYQDVKILRGGSRGKRMPKLPKEKDFAVSHEESTSGMLVMRPLRADLKRLFESAVIRVEPQSLRIVSIELRRGEEEWTRLEFKDIRIDEPIDETLFED